MKCPICDRVLTSDTEVYTTRRKSIHEGVEILGCDNCICTVWADEFFDEFELYEKEKAQDDYDNYLWDMSQENEGV